MRSTGGSDEFREVPPMRVQRPRQEKSSPPRKAPRHPPDPEVSCSVSQEDRFCEPHCAVLRPAQWLPSGSHSCFRSLKASQHIRQNLLMASRGPWGLAPASLQRSPQICVRFSRSLNRANTESRLTSSLSSLSDSHIAPRYHPFGPLRISRNTQLRPLSGFGENEI